MHIGTRKPGYRCEKSFIDCWDLDKVENVEKYRGKVKVKEVFSTKYLGEVICCDGTNTENVAARVKRGFGTVKDILNMLDRMCLGPFMFQKAVLLRDSMLVGTLLSCSEAWYNITEKELVQFEQVDKSLWCNLLEVARTVPYDLICLELGLEPIRFIIMRRRLMYLQHIMKQKESSLIKNFFLTQMKSLKKKDWGKTIIEDLKHLEVNISYKEIEHIPIETYKTLIKRKIKYMSLKYLLSKRNNRNGKGMELTYEQLKMQNYLLSEDIDISNEDRKYIFQLRSKMCFSIKTHFRNMHTNVTCGGCKTEESTTKHTLECISLLGSNELVTYIPNIEDLYGDNEDEQVYIARILKDNIRRLPE